MKLTILGTGTYYPRADRSSACYILNYKGENYVFDFGFGALQQIAKVGISIDKLKYFVFTHTHHDHAGGMYHLFTYLKNQVRRGLLPKNKKVIFYGPKQLNSYITKINNIFSEKSLLFSLKIKLIRNNQNFKVGNLSIKAKKVKHLDKEAYAFSIRTGRKTIVYAGDEDRIDELAGLAKKPDLLIAETAFPAKMNTAFHLSGKMTGQLANILQPKRLVITHFYPEAERVDIKKEVRKYFKGPIIKAKDFMEIKI